MRAANAGRGQTSTRTTAASNVAPSFNGRIPGSQPVHVSSTLTGATKIADARREICLQIWAILRDHKHLGLAQETRHLLFRRTPSCGGIGRHTSLRCWRSERGLGVRLSSGRPTALKGNMKFTQVLPGVMIVLDVAAAVVYAIARNPRQIVYWLAAAVLTASVAF